MKAIQKFIKENFEVLISIALIISIVFFMPKQTINRIFPIIWALQAMVTYNQEHRIQATLWFLFIPMAISMIELMLQQNFCGSFILKQLESTCEFTQRYPYYFEGVKDAHKYAENTFLLVLLSMFQLTMQIANKLDKDVLNDVLGEQLTDAKQIEKPKLIEDIYLLLKYIIYEIFKNFFYISLGIMFYLTTHSKNVLNYCYIFFFMFMQVFPSQAKSKWSILLMYFYMIMIVRFLYSLQQLDFAINHELAVFFGQYYKFGVEPDETAFYKEFWIAIAVSSLQFRLFNTNLNEKFENHNLRFRTKSMEFFRIYAESLVRIQKGILLSCCVWAFHFGLILTLIYSRKNLLNITVFVLETIFFIFHLCCISNRNKEATQKKIYIFWKIVVYLILFCSQIFYVVLFSSFTFFKRDLFGFLKSSGLPDELTMSYLMTRSSSQRTFEFYLQNVQLILAALSITIMNSVAQRLKEEILREEEEQKRLKEQDHKSHNTSLDIQQSDSNEESVESSNQEQVESTDEVNDAKTKIMEKNYSINQKSFEKFWMGIMRVLSNFFKIICIMFLMIWVVVTPSWIKIPLLMIYQTIYIKHQFMMKSLIKQFNLLAILKLTIKYFKLSMLKRFDIKIYFGSDICSHKLDHMFQMMCKTNYKLLRFKMEYANLKIYGFFYNLFFTLNVLYFIGIFTLQAQIVILKEEISEPITWKYYQCFELEDIQKEIVMSFIFQTILTIEKIIIYKTKRYMDAVKIKNEYYNKATNEEHESLGKYIECLLMLFINQYDLTKTFNKDRKALKQELKKANKIIKDHVIELMEQCYDPENDNGTFKIIRDNWIKNHGKIDTKHGEDNLYYKGYFRDNSMDPKDSDQEAPKKPDNMKDIKNYIRSHRLTDYDLDVDEEKTKNMTPADLWDYQNETFVFYLTSTIPSEIKLTFNRACRMKLYTAEILYSQQYVMNRLKFFVIMCIALYSQSAISIVLQIITFIFTRSTHVWFDSLVINCVCLGIIMIKDIVLLQNKIYDWQWVANISSSIFAIKNIKTSFIFMAVYFTLISLFMLVTIGISKNIIYNMHTLKLKRKRIYWDFHKQEESHKTLLVINYDFWEHNFSKVNRVYINIIAYALEFNMAIQILISNFAGRTYLLFIQIFTLIVYFIDYMIKATNKMDSIYKIMKWVFFALTYLTWILVFTYYCYTVYKGTDVNLQVWVVPFTIMMDELYYDQLKYKSFKKLSQNILRRKEILSDFIDIVTVYSENNKKFIENVYDYYTTNKINNICEDMMLDTELNQKHKIVMDDFTKSSTQFHDKLQSLLPKMDKTKYKIYSYIYGSLLKQNKTANFESIFYQHNVFCEANKNVQKRRQSKFDLIKYQKDDVVYLKEKLDSVKLFYDDQAGKDPELVNTYKKSMKKYVYTMEQEPNREQTYLDYTIVDKKTDEDQKNYISAEKIDTESSQKKERKMNYSKATDLIMKYVKGKHFCEGRKDTETRYTFKLQSDFTKPPTQIKFDNVKSYQHSKQDVFKFDFKLFMQQLYGAFINCFETLVCLYLTSIIVAYGGGYGIIVITLIIFIKIEERPGKYSLWMMLAIIQILVIIAWASFDTIYHLQTNDSHINWDEHKDKLPSKYLGGVVLFLLGSDKNFFWQTLGIVLIFIQRVIFMDQGCLHKSLLTTESTATASQRLLLNDKVLEQLNKKNRNLLKKSYKIHEKLNYFDKSEKSDINITSKVKFDIIKAQISAMVKNLRKRTIYSQYAYYVLLYMNKYSGFSLDKKYSKYFYRNFSKFSYKTGSDWSQGIFFVLILNLQIYLICYPYFNKIKNVKFTEIFMENTVRPELFFILLIYFLLQILEYYVTQLDYTEALICKEKNKRSVEKQQEIIDAKRQHSEFNPLQKFQSIVKKVIILNKIRNIDNKVTDNPYKNTSVKKLWITLIVWAFIVFQFWFFYPAQGNQDNTFVGFAKIFCNDTFYAKDGSAEATSGHCQSLYSSFWLKIFFITNFLYIVFSIRQIKEGYSQLKDSIIKINWLKLTNYVQFKLMKSQPQMREITTTVKFCASNTSLDYFEWLKMEDIKGDLLEAKYDSERKIINKPIGKKVSMVMHIATGAVSFILVVLVFMCPLLLFSEQNPSKIVDPVTKATINIKLIMNGFVDFPVMKDIELAAKEPKIKFLLGLTDSNDQKNRDILNSRSLLEYLNSNAKEAEITTGISEKFSSLINNASHSKLVLTMNVWTSMRQDSYQTYEKKINLDPELAKIWHELDTKKCKKETSLGQMFQTSFPPEMTIHGEDVELIENASLTRFPIILEFSCNRNGQKFIGIHRDPENSHFILVTNSVFNQSTTFMDKLNLGKTIIAVYITIITLGGMTIIRPFQLGKAHDIWIKKSPDALVLLLIVEGIQSARRNLNLYREKMQYLKLIDLLRSPKKLVNITGSFQKISKEKVTNRFSLAK